MLNIQAINFLFSILFISYASAKFISKDPATFEQRLAIARDVLDEVPLVDG